MNELSLTKGLKPRFLHISLSFAPTNIYLYRITVNSTSLFKIVRSPNGMYMQSNFPSFFPDRVAALNLESFSASLKLACILEKNWVAPRTNVREPAL